MKWYSPLILNGGLGSANNKPLVGREKYKENFDVSSEGPSLDSYD
jgi:hypothetical protein